MTRSVPWAALTALTVAMALYQCSPSESAREGLGQSSAASAEARASGYGSALSAEQTPTAAPTVEIKIAFFGPLTGPAA